VALGEREALGEGVGEALRQSVGEADGRAERLKEPLGEGETLEQRVGEAVAEEDLHSVGLGLGVLLVLPVRLSVTVAQSEGRAVEERHRVGEAL
jgi:hypothetical protein